MSEARRESQLRLSDREKLIHEMTRYNIMTLLYVVESAEFLFVQNQLSLTAGNLSAHLSKLETAGLVVITKKFVGKKPRTFVALSDEGRTAFESYRRRMQEALAAPLTGDSGAAKKSGDDPTHV